MNNRFLSTTDDGCMFKYFTSHDGKASTFIDTFDHIMKARIQA